MRIFSTKFRTLSSNSLPILFAAYSLFPVPEKYKIIDFTSGHVLGMSTDMLDTFINEID